MPWWGWLSLGIGQFLAAYRITFRGIVLDACGTYENVDGMDLFFSLFFGAILAAVAGPLVLLYALARTRTTGGDAGSVARLIGGETRHEKQQRREQELRDRERRIRQIERELGIDA